MDLVIDRGQVEGEINLNQNVLTVGEHGRSRQDRREDGSRGRQGPDGNIIAAEKVDIRDTSSIEGDIYAPRVVIADGAYFRGGIDMAAVAKRSPAATSAADSGVDVPDKSRAKDAPKPESVRSVHFLLFTKR